MTFLLTLLCISSTMLDCFWTTGEVATVCWTLSESRLPLLSLATRVNVSMSICTTIFFPGLFLRFCACSGELGSGPFCSESLGIVPLFGGIYLDETCSWRLDAGLELVIEVLLELSPRILIT